LAILDPQVDPNQVYFDLSVVNSNLEFQEIQKRVTIYKDDVIGACDQSHAIVVCTEWDCFKEYNYETIYDIMKRPASIFDGRLLLDHKHLKSIGFQVEVIGKN
jgi:UDPglucose 6-dehydrogenase